MITSRSSTPVQIFISSHSVGASAQIGDILRFCDFFPGWLYCIFWPHFFSVMHPVRTSGWIFTVYGSYDVFAQERSFWWFQQYWNSFGGNIPQNSRSVFSVRRPCSDFTDMLWRLTNCRIIIIINGA